MRYALIACLAAGLPLLATSTVAAEEHRQLGAHEHGHGTLNIAIEAGKVAMELAAPGSDIVGFEHQPSTAEQKQKVADARKALHDDAAKLFALPEAAGCTLSAAEVEISAGEHKEHEGDHAHEAKGGQAAAKGEHEEEHEGHNEFHATYEFACASPDKLTGIDLGFFAQFPGSLELDVTVLDAKGQKQYEVARDTPKLEFQGQ